MKPCTRCAKVKELSEFRKNLKMRFGADSWCKACVSEHRTATRQALKAVPKPALTEKKCGGCGEVKPAESFSLERGRWDGLSRICRPCRSAKHRANYARDPQAWREKAIQGNRRRSADPAFIVQKRVSARVREWLGTRRGGKRCFDLLGYSLPELREHLERQFSRGMSWDNIGQWHIDHIIPLSSFVPASADDPELRRAWALPNLRPLWARDNLRKHDKRETLL